MPVAAGLSLWAYGRVEGVGSCTTSRVPLTAALAEAPSTTASQTPGLRDACRGSHAGSILASAFARRPRLQKGRSTHRPWYSRSRDHWGHLTLTSSHAANLLAPYRSRPGPAASRTRASKNKHLDQPPKGRPPRLRCTSTQPPWGGRMTPWDDCTVTGFHAPSCVPMRVYCRLFRQRRPAIWRIEAGAPWHLRGRPVIRKRNSRSEAVGAREPNTKQNHRTNTALARAQLGLSAISK